MLNYSELMQVWLAMDRREFDLENRLADAKASPESIEKNRRRLAHTVSAKSKIYAMLNERGHIEFPNGVPSDA